MSSLADFPEEPPDPAEVLRAVAKSLDQLGVLVLHLANAAEQEHERGADDPILTSAEAAKELRCSERHIRAACARGKLKARLNGGWKIRRSSLLVYERRLTGIGGPQ